jgi:hypothetical protein
MYHENQKTINEWADKTFGHLKSGQVAINRFMEEVEEFEKLDFRDEEMFDAISDECADMLITLYRIAYAFGFDLHSCVDYKMSINRSRKWKSYGDGTGQHIKE